MEFIWIIVLVLLTGAFAFGHYIGKVDGYKTLEMELNEQEGLDGLLDDGEILKQAVLLANEQYLEIKRAEHQEKIAKLKSEVLKGMIEGFNFEPLIDSAKWDSEFSETTDQAQAQEPGKVSIENQGASLKGDE